MPSSGSVFTVTVVFLACNTAMAIYGVILAAIAALGLGLSWR